MFWGRCRSCSTIHHHTMWCCRWYRVHEAHQKPDRGRKDSSCFAWWNWWHHRSKYPYCAWCAYRAHLPWCGWACRCRNGCMDNSKVNWILPYWSAIRGTRQNHDRLVMIWIIAIQMPFVDKTGFVAGSVQYRSDGRILRLQTCSANDGRVSFRGYFQTSHASCCTHIITYTAIAGILTRHQCTTWWWTDSWPGIALVESSTRSSQFINVWSLDSLAAVAGEIAISQIIGKDENDIGSVILQK